MHAFLTLAASRPVRELLAVFALVAGVPSFAQEAGGYSAGPSKATPEFQTVVHASPAETQDRQFSTTRFWLLDPGRYEVEVWWSNKYQPDGTSEGLLQAEIEIGLAPHLQLDLYQNVSMGTAPVELEGNQLELRYAFGSHYNEIPLNPVLYLEWHPRKNAQDRAEVRMLLGGDGPAHSLYAVNVYAEANVDDFHGAATAGLDMEAGVSGAINFPIAGDALRFGAEVKTGVDMHGSPNFAPVLLVGPNVVLKSKSAGLKLTGTFLFGLMPQDPRLYPLVIAGWQF